MSWGLVFKAQGQKNKRWWTFVITVGLDFITFEASNVSVKCLEHQVLKSFWNAVWKWDWVPCKLADVGLIWGTPRQNSIWNEHHCPHLVQHATRKSSTRMTCKTNLIPILLPQLLPRARPTKKHRKQHVFCPFEPNLRLFQGSKPKNAFVEVA